jgi:hypothetical protein
MKYLVFGFAVVLCVFCALIDARYLYKDRGTWYLKCFKIFSRKDLSVRDRSLYFCRGVAPKHQTSTIKYQLKNKHPPLAKKLHIRIPFSYHTCPNYPLPLLWHEFDKCLCNYLQSKVSSCLHMYFLWRHFHPDKSENDQNSDSDWFTYRILTYDCWHCFLVFYTWVRIFVTIHFYYSTLELLLLCFSFTPPFSHSNFGSTSPFLFPPPPPHKYCRSLTERSLFMAGGGTEGKRVG